MTTYKPLENYGIIGNLETCALAGNDGSIDWLCLPYLDSPSVFAALLDNKRGGSFQIAPVKKYQSKQSYSKNSNVLHTTFSSREGTVTVTDFMEVCGRKSIENDGRVLYRKVACSEGDVELKVVFEPRFDYARTAPVFETAENGIVSKTKNEKIFLKSPVLLNVKDGRCEGLFRISKGEEGWFVLRYGEPLNLTNEECDAAMREIKEYWHGWTDHASFEDPVSKRVAAGRPWQDIIIRSGLALQLLVDPEFGSIAAAATTSLPEEVGGVRNWDYRYAWIRDASFSVQAFFHLGHIKESRGFFRWIWDVIDRYNDPADIKIMYSLRGRTDFKETELGNLEGYKKSSPVRIGNGAVDQKQLDIYGELLNMVYETTRYGEKFPKKLWPKVSRLVDYVCEIWKTKDSGIWETRGEKQHFVYSKVMCWAAIDRGIRIAEEKKLKAPVRKWKKERENLKKEILKKGFNKKLNSFVQAFGSDALDATSLLIPIVGFLPSDDERIQGTIAAIQKNLMTPDGLVFRYKSEDGLPGSEGKFLLCSFWLVKALALSGKIEEAEGLFEKLLKFVSPLGLLSEEVDPNTKKLIGNFPQAFSHIGLINSALYLDIARGKAHSGPKPMGV